MRRAREHHRRSVVAAIGSVNNAWVVTWLGSCSCARIAAGAGQRLPACSDCCERLLDPVCLLAALPHLPCRSPGQATPCHAACLSRPPPVRGKDLLLKSKLLFVSMGFRKFQCMKNNSFLCEICQCGTRWAHIKTAQNHMAKDHFQTQAMMEGPKIQKESKSRFCLLKRPGPIAM